MVSPVLISDSPLVCLKTCSARLPRTSWGSTTGPHAAVGGGRAEDETRWQPPPFVPDMFSIGLRRGQRLRDPVEVLFQGRLEPTHGQPLALAFRSKDKLKDGRKFALPEPGARCFFVNYPAGTSTPREPPSCGCDCDPPLHRPFLAGQATPPPRLGNPGNGLFLTFFWLYFSMCPRFV